MRSKQCFLSVLYMFLCLTLLSMSVDAKPIQVLLLSGANNHDWRSTTPYLERLCEHYPDIRVTITNCPDTLNTEMLKGKDVIVSNWNTFPENTFMWSKESRQALEQFVRNGGGFVTVHAGSCSNYDWDFFLQLTGGRWGKDTHHGAIEDFEVKVAKEHPITKGITSFQFRDELWESVEWSEGVEVLCTARTSSGVDEPIAVVKQLDRGRSFFLVLGHDAEIMQQPMFEKLLIRGIRWTAGKKIK